MIIKSLFHGFLFRTVTVAVLVAVSCNSSATAQNLDFDKRATATAQLLAGIAPPPGDRVMSRLAALDCWYEHQNWMKLQWDQVQTRLRAMQHWRAQELRIRDAQSKTLLYPFSGPDFLNSYTLVPDHARYIFFGLEVPGRLPDLESHSATQFEQLLQDMRDALFDVFERNYFITDHMTRQLTTPQLKGTLPTIATMMALMNLQIVRIEPVDLFPELTSTYKQPGADRPRKLMRGVRIAFTGANPASVQELYYFSLDASDKALEFYPDFLNWVGRNRPATAFLKSASYLLHDNQFAKTREMLLASADFVIQDDSGIPYRFLAQPPWKVRFYGEYAKPIPSLSYGYDPHLESAYQTRKNVPALPFPFGYHGKSGKSGLITASRKRS